MTEAKKGFRLAAEKGNADAQVELGGMYITGRGVVKNREIASKWYEEAQKQAYSYAQDARRKKEKQNTR